MAAPPGTEGTCVCFTARPQPWTSKWTPQHLATGQFPIAGATASGWSLAAQPQLQGWSSSRCSAHGGAAVGSAAGRWALGGAALVGSTGIVAGALRISRRSPSWTPTCPPASGTSPKTGGSTSSTSPVGRLTHTSPTMTNFAAGLVAGIAVDVPLHPLDTIKTRLQAPEGFAASGGFRGLWSGLSPVLLRSLPCSAIFFVSYDHLRYGLSSVVPCAPGAIWRDAVAGSAANVAACAVRVPCEVLKQRMQAHKTLYRTEPTLFNTIFRVGADGVRGFYTGFGATVARELAFAAVQMPLFEQLKRMHPWNDSSASSGAQRGLVGMVCGGVAGAFAGAVTTPLDVIKTRAMLSGRPTGHVGIFRSLAALYADFGVQALFRGVLPRTAYVGASCALSFGTFEWSKWILLSLQRID